MNDTMLKLTRLWGRLESRTSTPTEQYVADILKNVTSKELKQVLVTTMKTLESTSEEECEYKLNLQVAKIVDAKTERIPVTLFNSEDNVFSF